MKKRLVFFLVLFFVKLFSKSNDNHSKEVFIKIKDNFNFNLENYKIKLSKKSKIDVDFNKNLLFNIFDKFKIKSIKKASKLKDLKLSKVYKITLDDSTNYKLFEIELNNQITIEYVEIVPTHTLISFPNDKSSQQWHFTNINAAQAWDLHTGTGSVVIAIVDDAIRLDHEDIAPNVWVNPNEIAGNGIDDDGNGYVDDINGYDVADGNNNPTTTNPNKTHGTHCAGIAAAKSNNGVGIASISSNCKIMAVKCTKDAVISPNIPYAYEGLEYAIVSNPDVISLSWGGGFFSRTYQLLFDYAHSLGIVVVAAAGNNSSSLWMYPASYNHVISVGATDINDKITYFSNFGSKIDVMAPGDEI
ncbi:MAG: hypothetical protein EAZ27_13195 [Cytophagales bacterium]|nr:MAG: hypothetical protein EAZ27_13195 [Cytophagales bacterium]